jgi:hypothetical protein
MRKTRRVDMSGDMPGSAWVEVHGEDGALLASIPSVIDGGSISTDLPAFEPGLRGTITQVTEYADGETYRDQGEVGDLPTSPVISLVMMG